MVATTPSRPCPVGRRSWGRGEAVATSVRVSRSQSVGVRDTETGGSTLSGAWGPCPGSWRTGGEHRLPQEVGEPGRGRKGRPAWPLGVKPPFSGVCRAQTGLRGPAADGLLHCRPLRLGHHRAGGVCFSVNGSVCRSVPKSAHEVLRLGKGRSEEHVLLQGGAGGAGRGAPPALGATAGRPTPGWTGSASLARMALPAPRWSWAAASEPPGPWCGGGCVRPAKPQSDSRPAGGGPPGDSDRAAPGRGAGEAARVGRARAGGRRALTASELEGFAWPWRLELLLRDQTLVLCLKAALTFEGGRGRVRIGVRG